ncbi:zinc-dependent metalloprotease [Idiomarina seosinensis]|uniref:zinc-dependent metalloprotease n=1 Tax=Idiomarina seosinensis TaxID=281739 RepID=UPI003850DB68
MLLTCTERPLKPRSLRAALSAATVTGTLVAALFISPLAQAADEKPLVADFTEQMTLNDGYFDFYYAADAGKIYLDIPKQSQPFIFQTSLPWGLGSNDIGLDRGQLGDTQLASFHIQGDKVLLLAHNTRYRASSRNQAERDSVDQAFADGALQGFKVVAKDADSVLIDYTPYLLTDVHGISDRLAATNQGDFKADSERSVVYPERSKAFVDNTELEAKVTFVGKAEGRYVRQVAANSNALTLHLHHSFIRLPDDQYQAREFHPNSGFWAETFIDYSAPLGEDIETQVIPRHRLHKKDPIAARSEAQQPIIYYLDPGAPEPVKSALQEGGRWWSEAFEAIGFENAFQVKTLPADADPMDVRYNVIQWVHRATRGWSYGSSVIDPRTGEIMKGHVTLGSLRVRQDMKIAEGLLGPFNKDNREQLRQDIEAMALARIRQLSAHEIGHTLGIAHNFAASAQDRASVMDYPHPLITLTTEGRISLQNAYDVGLGQWDKQVIAYGYSDFGGMPSEPEQLARILQTNKELGLNFISDRDARPASGAHPTAHLWDNGSDPVTELQRLLTVREHVLNDFDRGQLAADKPLSDLQEVLVPMYLLHRYQTEAAVKWVGGVNYRYYMNDERPDDYQKIGAADQQRALEQVLKTARYSGLQLPDQVKQLMVPLAYGSADNRERFEGRTGLIPDPVSWAASAADFSLQLLFNSARLNRLQQQHTMDTDIPSAAGLFNQVAASFLQDWQQQPDDSLRQRLLTTAFNAMVKASQAEQLAPEVHLALRSALQTQQRKLADQKTALTRQLAAQLKAFLDDGEWPDSYQPHPLPPGSPI